jgi:hypothetical protein
MIRKIKVRARNIDQVTLDHILNILDGWNEKLTWEDLIKKIHLKLNINYTRQALSQHTQIKHAFQLTKQRLNGKARKKTICVNDTQQVLIDRISKLEAENTRLRQENERLLEQFVIWSYNGYVKGLDINLLNNSLPKINRNQTKI